MARKKRQFDKKNVLLVGILAILGLIVGILLFGRYFGSSEAPITQDQIQLKKGNQIVIVNRNGLVEYRSEDGVFYENWDGDRVSSFFSSMEARAREYLNDPPANPPAGAYEVTLYIDGELVVIYIDLGDEEIDEIFEEFDNQGSGGDGDLSEYFSDEEGSGEETDSQSGTNPTPTSFFAPTSTPTPTPFYVGGGSGEQAPPDCDLFGSQVNQRTVISNTICNLDE